MSKDNSSSVTLTGGIGSTLAAVISWVHWHSFGWAFLHFILGWAYVIYYVIRYGLK